MNDYIRQYDELVKSTVKHPAIFGYAIGNEISDSVSQNPQFWMNFGKLIDAAHGAGVSQGKNPFLITAITDDYTSRDTWPAIKAISPRETTRFASADSFSTGPMNIGKAGTTTRRSVVQTGIS